MGRRIKYESGTASNYISRAAAVKKLQISLKDFHRLCILKGIYPRDPVHKKKANKGSTQNKVFYHARDIQYLTSEPLINKFREYKTYMKKLIRAKNKRERNKATILQINKPDFKLDHLVRERYPTFSLALRDLDDCLNLLFAFALLPKSKVVKSTVIEDCRRLTAEFLHYVIEAQCLTKVFVSIKGTYFQAQIMGEKVTWLMGHQRSVGRVQDVDFATLANFVDFYTTALSFINFRLYKSIGLLYPPKLARSKNANSDDVEDELYSLAHELQGTAEDIAPVDVFAEMEDDGDIADKMKEMMKLKTLFKGCKFFLNREVPNDTLTLVIRNCGGMVSWDGCPGGKYSENFDGITHHVIDRPLTDSFTMNRIYIQPQWVLDCFNYRKILPVNKYVPGAHLPPHLSPFVLESSGDYIPPERMEMLRELGKEIPAQKENAPILKAKTKAKKSEKKDKVLIKEGKVFNANEQQLLHAAGHTKKLREMMIPKRYKNAYKKIQFGIKRKAKETRALEDKRRKREVVAAVEK
uniref:Pescadillo homolog n=1 Tax=Panagrolaimus superbus TaxID=310955 RepID=A0A914YT64_9BILA